MVASLGGFMVASLVGVCSISSFFASQSCCGLCFVVCLRFLCFAFSGLVMFYSSGLAFLPD
jgi:hypothetical protein